MLKIANNITIAHLRRRRLDTLRLEGSLYPTSPANMTATALGLAERSHSAPTRADRRALARALEQAIGRLRKQDRRCIILQDIEGRSYEDIAEILHLPVGTVSTYLYRARKELRDTLDALRESLLACSSGTPASG